jgi:hypothetical protein
MNSTSGYVHPKDLTAELWRDAVTFWSTSAAEFTIARMEATQLSTKVSG